jgi:hypothetical protein
MLSAQRQHFQQVIHLGGFGERSAFAGRSPSLAELPPIW